MSNSSLVTFRKISPNKTVGRKNPIDRITPHCVVGQASVEALGNLFGDPARQASSNYGIGYDAEVGMYCEEKDRSWCSSSSANDNRAITIECASDTTYPYAMKNIVYDKLIELCVDICKRNGKTKLLWIADKDRALSYKLAPDEMLITVHRWFAATDCPGDWLYERLGDLAAKVTTKLSSAADISKEESNVFYRVQIGAFGQLKNAENCLAKAKAAGFNDAFIVAVDKDVDKQNEQKTEEPKEVILKEGDLVKMQKGAPVYGEGYGFQNFVYNSVLFVRDVVGDRVVISTAATGPITGVVDKKYLTKV